MTRHGLSHIRAIQCTTGIPVDRVDLPLHLANDHRTQGRHDRRELQRPGNGVDRALKLAVLVRHGHREIANGIRVPGRQLDIGGSDLTRVHRTHEREEIRVVQPDFSRGRVWRRWRHFAGGDAGLCCWPYDTR
jgi:hypothetical protein